MTFSSQLDSRLPAIQAIDLEHRTLNRSVTLAEQLHEAMNLYEWVQRDRDELVKHGLDWGLVEDLEGRVAAAMVAERRYVLMRDGDQADEVRDHERMKRGRELYDKIRKALRRVYRLEKRSRDEPPKAVYIKDDRVSWCLREIVSLARLSYAEGLKQINFDMTLLDEGRALVHKVNLASGDAKAHRGVVEVRAQQLRDRAFIYLNDAVSPIREAGEYVFVDNKERLRGYRSEYRRRRRGRGKGESDENGQSSDDETQENW